VIIDKKESNESKKDEEEKMAPTDVIVEEPAKTETEETAEKKE